MGTKQTEKYAEAAGQIAPYDPQARAGALAEYMSSVHIYRMTSSRASSSTSTRS